MNTFANVCNPKNKLYRIQTKNIAVTEAVTLDLATPINKRPVTGMVSIDHVMGMYYVVLPGFRKSRIQTHRNNGELIVLKQGWCISIWGAHVSSFF